MDNQTERAKPDAGDLERAEALLNQLPIINMETSNVSGPMTVTFKAFGDPKTIIAAALAEARRAGESKWLPIDENTPRHGNYVRVYMEEGVLFCPNGGEATHWLPLPVLTPEAEG